MTDRDGEIGAAMTQADSIGDALNRLRQCGLSPNAISALGTIFDQLERLKGRLRAALGQGPGQPHRGS